MQSFSAATKSNGRGVCVPLLLSILIGCLICAVIITRSELESIKSDFKQFREQLKSPREDGISKAGGEVQWQVEQGKRSTRQANDLTISNLLSDGLSAWIGVSDIRPIIKCFVNQRNKTKCSVVPTQQEDVQSTNSAASIMEDAIEQIVLSTLQTYLNCSFDEQSNETKCGSLPGTPGPKGEIGERGAIGPPGIQGDKGVRGKKGVKGKRGTDGVNGQPGNVGPEGPPGRPGSDGEPGDVGPEGPPGQPGSVGAPGDVGPKGPPGQPGSDGVTGEPGDVGPEGPPGRDGAPGDVGPIGPPGSQSTRLPGRPGPPGQPGSEMLDQKDPLGDQGQMDHQELLDQ